jgi:endogenous inhibitor of DNA gyrase (YacG/DUF329 family)
MARKVKCPLCARPTDPATAPFCSRGCRDRDLLAWLGESYRTPGRGLEEDAADNDRIAPDDDGG